MKKNKYIRLIIAMLLLISSLSIWNNIKTSLHQDYVKEVMVNHTYFKLNDISKTLSSVFDEKDSQSEDYHKQQEQLNLLKNDFIELHSILTYYSIIFETNYGGFINFEFVSDTLTTGTGNVNSNVYNAILEDNKISEDEYEYFSILKNSIDVMIQSMTSNQNPLQENQELTTDQFDNILILFFDTWSWHDKDSPFFLLCK